jgi:NitT/TauT family transport system permease protein
LQQSTKDDRAGDILPGLILPAVVLGVWILATEAGLKPALIPSPASVLGILSRPFESILASGSLAWNCFVSIVRVLVGFSIAAMTAVPAGLLMGSNRNARRFLSVSVELARPMSPLALVPLMLVLFRSRTLVDVLGLTSLRYSHHLFHEIQVGMIVVLVWGGFFPILLGAAGGARSVRRIHVEAAGLLGAGRSMLFRYVVLPSAMPDIMTGLRLGMGRCWMVIVASEMMPGTNSGLGYLIRYAYEVQRTDVMFAGLVVIALVGALLSAGLDRIGRRSFVLRREER